MGRANSAAAAQQADPALRKRQGGGGEFLGSRRIDELMIVSLGQAGAGKGGQGLAGIETFEQMQRVSAIDAIHADDFSLRGADFCDSGAKGHRVIPGEQRHHGAVVESLLGLEGDPQFIGVEKGFEENELATAIEEGANLFGEDFVPVDAPGRGFFRSDAQWTDAAGHVSTLAASHVFGQLCSGPIDFADAMFAAMLGEAHGIGPEAVGLDDPGAGSDVGFVNSPNDLGLADAKLFQAASRGNAGGQELGSHRAIPEQDAVLKFIEKIHGRGDYSRRAVELPRTKAERWATDSVLVSGTDAG
jgi:hypothetical protein